MPSKEVTVKEWPCAGCPATAQTEKSNHGLPPGWTNTTAMISGGATGERFVGLELCPVCSKDPASAIKRYKAGIGQ